MGTDQAGKEAAVTEDANVGGSAAAASATIDERAPVVGASESVIAAAPEIVWDVLAKIEDWPTWNSDVKWASIDGDVAEGTEFRWKSGPGTVTSTLQRVERPRLLAWTGRTLGIDAVHVWRFEPKDGATLVRTEESFDGVVARLLRRPLRKTLAGALESGVRHLKAEAERRAQR